MEKIEFMVTLIVAVFGSTGFWSWLQVRFKKRSAEDRLLMGIGYSKIKQETDHYIKRGWISSDEYNDLYRHLYLPYVDMGGNGTAKRQMEIVKSLPSTPPKKGDKK